MVEETVQTTDAQQTPAPAPADLQEVVNKQAKEIARLAGVVKARQEELASLKARPTQSAPVADEDDDEGYLPKSVKDRLTRQEEMLSKLMESIGGASQQRVEADMSAAANDLKLGVQSLSRATREAAVGDLGEQGNAIADKIVYSIAESIASAAMASGQGLSEKLLVDSVTESANQLKALVGLFSEKQFASNAAHAAADPVTARQSQVGAGQLQQEGSQVPRTRSAMAAMARAAAEAAERMRPGG